MYVLPFPTYIGCWHHPEDRVIPLDLNRCSWQIKHLKTLWHIQFRKWIRLFCLKKCHAAQYMIQSWSNITIMLKSNWMKPSSKSFTCRKTSGLNEKPTWWMSIYIHFFSCQLLALATTTKAGEKGGTHHLKSHQCQGCCRRSVSPRHLSWFDNLTTWITYRSILNKTFYKTTIVPQTCMHCIHPHTYRSYQVLHVVGRHVAFAIAGCHQHTDTL